MPDESSLDGKSVSICYSDYKNYKKELLMQKKIGMYISFLFLGALTLIGVGCSSNRKGDCADNCAPVLSLIHISEPTRPY